MDARVRRDGPKRRRRTRRELPEGQFTQWPKSNYNVRRERDRALARQHRKEMS